MAQKTLHMKPTTTTALGEIIETIPTGGLTDAGAAWQTSTNGGAISGDATSSDLKVGTTQPPGSFTSHATTPKPTAIKATANVNAFRSVERFTGIFVPGVWEFSIGGKAGSNAVGATTSFLIKLHREGSNADGSDAEVLAHLATAGLVGFSANQSKDYLINWTAPELVFDNEYMYISLALLINKPEGNKNATRVVQLLQGASTSVTTPDMQPLGASYVGWIGI